MDPFNQTPMSAVSPPHPVVDEALQQIDFSYPWSALADSDPDALSGRMAQASRSDDLASKYDDVGESEYDSFFCPMDPAVPQISNLTPTHALSTMLAAKGNHVLPTTTTCNPAMDSCGPLIPHPSAYITLATSGLSNPPLIYAPPAIPISTDFLSHVFIESLIRPQVEVYFERINPMMPVLTREEILGNLGEPSWLANRDNLALVLAVAGIALVHPWTTEEKAQRCNREKQAMMLLDQACHLVAAWDYGCVGTVEKTLTSFIMFGILHELGHIWGARIRLRDTITMGDSMQLNNRLAYSGLDACEARRRLRLFYILAVTER